MVPIAKPKSIKQTNRNEDNQPLPRKRFDSQSGKGHVVGFHIFPDGLYAVVSDLDAAILNEKSIPFKENEALEKVVAAMSAAYRWLLGRDTDYAGKVIGIAVGAHGITDFRNGVIIHSPHFPSWGENAPLTRLLKKELSFEGPVLVDNQIRFQVFLDRSRRFIGEVSLLKIRRNVEVVYSKLRNLERHGEEQWLA